MACRRDEFEEDLKAAKASLCLVVKEEEQLWHPILEEVQGLLEEFEDVL